MKTLIPVVVLLIAPVMAQAAEEVGDWVYETDDGHYAVTINDSSHILGQWCSTETQTCAWVLAIDTSCKEGDEYLVLANTDTGAAAVEVTCDGSLSKDMFRYVFSDFDVIDKLVREANRIGIAFPLQGDRFAVERFGLAGASRAVDLMRDHAQEVTHSATGTDSQVL